MLSKLKLLILINIIKNNQLIIEHTCDYILLISHLNKFSIVDRNSLIEYVYQLPNSSEGQNLNFTLLKLSLITGNSNRIFTYYNKQSDIMNNETLKGNHINNIYCEISITMIKGLFKLKFYNYVMRYFKSMF